MARIGTERRCTACCVPQLSDWNGHSKGPRTWRGPDCLAVNERGSLLPADVLLELGDSAVSSASEQTSTDVRQTLLDTVDVRAGVDRDETELLEGLDLQLVSLLDLLSSGRQLLDLGDLGVELLGAGVRLVQSRSRAVDLAEVGNTCLLYTSPSPRDS